MPSNSLAFLNQPVSLKQLDLIEIDLPQVGEFQSAIGIRKSRKALIIKWTDRDDFFGFGECACRPDPFYSPEFLEAAKLAVEHFLFPAINGAEQYSDVATRMEKIRGWNFAKAAVEAAAHGSIRSRLGTTIFDEFPHSRLNHVPVGISMGIQPSAEVMFQKVQEATNEKYSRIKFKISPKVNPNLYRELLQQFPDQHFSFDANGTFTAKDFDQLNEFAQLGKIIEQPLPPTRLDLCLLAKAAIPALQICLDEEITGIGVLKTAHSLQVIDELNVKPGRVGGLTNSLEMLQFCFENDLPVWIGGMFETGIGRSANINLASFCTDATGHDISPSSRYFPQDIVTDPVTMEDGKVDHARFGEAEVDEAILEKYTISKKTLKA